jgi:GNAT superfamily N-acetyltransferase
LKNRPSFQLLPFLVVLPFGIEIRIRPAQVSDCEIIADFNAKMALETEQRQLDFDRVRAGVAALLRDAAKGVYYIAEAGGQVAGQLLITWEWSDWRNGNFWWIQSVYVLPDFRGAGVFRALFGHVHTLARGQQGICGLRLYMDAHNDRARSAYERLGMKQTNYQVFEMDFVLKDHV